MVKLGTFAYNNKIYNLDYMTSNEIKDVLEIVEKCKLENFLDLEEITPIRDEIILSAKLNILYIHRSSKEIVNQKVSNQINSINILINRINPKFNENSKNYGKVQDEIMQMTQKYEQVLSQFANNYDTKIEQKIYEKVELEYRLIGRILRQKTLHDSEESLQNKNFILKLKKQVRSLNTEIKALSEEKKVKLFDALESGGKAITTQISKPKKIKSITKFLANRFNTFKVIMKSVIEPVNYRINEFRVNKMEGVRYNINEINIGEIDKKIENIIKSIDKYK